MNILVLGRAKTGTTILAKTLQANLEKHRLWFEPRSLKHFFDPRSPNVVTKVIFEHWDDRPHSRLALINNELEMKFDKRIAIVRDPRDELVSRMYYMARGAILNRDISPINIARWIELIRRKEAEPHSISLQDMLAQMSELLGAHLGFNPGGAFDYFDFVRHHFANDHILRYEAFIDGDRQALAQYLGFALTQAPEPDELISRTRRSASHSGWKQLFLAADLDAYLNLHGPALAALGYVDNALDPDPRLDPAHGSDYVLRIAQAAIAEKRQRQADAQAQPQPQPQPQPASAESTSP